MDVRAIFGISVLSSFMGFAVAPRQCAWPWLRTRGRNQALVPLVAPHTFLRFIGRSFLVPWVVSPARRLYVIEGQKRPPKPTKEKGYGYQEQHIGSDVFTDSGRWAKSESPWSESQQKRRRDGGHVLRKRVANWRGLDACC